MLASRLRIIDHSIKAGIEGHAPLTSPQHRNTYLYSSMKPYSHTLCTYIHLKASINWQKWLHYPDRVCSIIQTIKAQKAANACVLCLKRLVDDKLGLYSFSYRVSGHFKLTRPRRYTKHPHTVESNTCTCTCTCNNMVYIIHACTCTCISFFLCVWGEGGREIRGLNMHVVAE